VGGVKGDGWFFIVSGSGAGSFELGEDEGAFFIFSGGLLEASMLGLTLPSGQKYDRAHSQ
jgi:hypothetical protein